MRIGRFEADDSTRIGLFNDETVTDVSEAFDGFQDALSRPSDAYGVDGEEFDRERISY